MTTKVMSSNLLLNECIVSKDSWVIHNDNKKDVENGKNTKKVMKKERERS